MNDLIERTTKVYEEAGIADEKVSHFLARTNLHIDLVQEAVQKIVDAFGLLFGDIDEFTFIGRKNLLLINSNMHDALKFVEPEYEPYVELAWRKKEGNTEVTPEIMKATYHHIKNSSHHPEFWDESAELSSTNRDATAKVVDASRMPAVSVLEMVADWVAMSQELGTNTPRQWYDKVRDTRFKFTPEQESLIDRTLKIFEE